MRAKRLRSDKETKMSTRLSRSIALLVLIAMAALLYSCTQPGNEGTTPSGTASGELDRTVLPIKEPIRQTYKELDVRNAKAPARFEVKAPGKAPNVVIVLIDDQGFGGRGPSPLCMSWLR
jgi:arylsulfatase